MIRTWTRSSRCRSCWDHVIQEYWASPRTSGLSAVWHIWQFPWLACCGVCVSTIVNRISYNFKLGPTFAIPSYEEKHLPFGGGQRKAVPIQLTASCVSYLLSEGFALGYAMSRFSVFSNSAASEPSGKNGVYVLKVKRKFWEHVQSKSFSTKRRRLQTTNGIILTGCVLTWFVWIRTTWPTF